MYGYIIYRAVDPKGPFLRINSRIIPRDKEPDVKGVGLDKKKSNYRYVDESADSTVTNYYYIDAIGESGRKKRLTGVVSKLPKNFGQQD
ncbi:hypothetical protein [Dokdonella sp.]|uniref:hypothetical protein n=1 Tax=Dokdonella sp. TaxID=2291710 RepID=UPI003528CE43